MVNASVKRTRHGTLATIAAISCIALWSMRSPASAHEDEPHEPATEGIEPTDPPPDETQPVEPTDPIDEVDPVEPTDPTDDPDEPTDSPDEIDPVEPIDPLDEIEPIAPPVPDNMRAAAVGAWVKLPNTTGERSDSGTCPLEIVSFGRTGIALGLHSHGNPKEPDDAYAELSGLWQMDRDKLRKLAPQIRFDLVCGTGPGADAEGFSSEWLVLPFGPREFSYCPPHKPYMMRARCQSAITVTQ